MGDIMIHQCQPHTIAIPLDTLKDWIRAEGWRRMAVEFQSLLPATVPENKGERDMVKSQANRKNNLAFAEQLP